MKRIVLELNDIQAQLVAQLARIGIFGESDVDVVRYFVIRELDRLLKDDSVLRRKP